MTRSPSQQGAHSPDAGTGHAETCVHIRNPQRACENTGFWAPRLECLLEYIWEENRAFLAESLAPTMRQLVC